MFDQFLSELKKKKLHIVEGDRKVTAAAFVAGVGKKSQCIPQGGGRVYFSLSRSIDSLQWFFAFLKAGYLVFIGNPLYSRAKLQSLINYIKPRFAVLPNFQAFLIESSTTRLLDSNTKLISFDPYEPILDPLETSAQLAILTSGTTGNPKSILHRFSSILHNAALHAEAITLQERDCVGAALPFHFSYGLVAVVFGTLLKGASLHLAPPVLPEDLAHWLQHISVFSATPLLMSKLPSLANLRVLTIGGDITPPLLAKQCLLKKNDLMLFTTYGLTEAGPRVATHRVTPDDFSSSLPMGTPLPSVSWSIASDNELLIHTPTAMLGYFRDPEETKAVLSNGILSSGDLVKRERGNLFFIGRKKRLLTRGGEKIFPTEIENSLREYPSIEDAFVTLEEEGQILKAYLKTSSPLDIKHIRAFLKQRLSRAHVPDTIDCCEALPEMARKK